MSFILIDENFSVSPQIDVADVQQAAAEGYKLIINNRPDNEVARQPLNAELEQIAQELGLAYKSIPITPPDFLPHEIEAMAETLRTAPGRVLAFCRSGTRSTLLWALARRTMGDSAETLDAKALAAGYDLTSIHGRLA
ncbi:MAG: TIGR01244 family phosphatase [Alphaproteobacteria bacterium]|nr:TIGR01244 family phosphatase [Alphaproteobacteria bacterium]MDE2340064.1 TIGR01244 family phosphatase [Alphaproteobacteria bacterium]